MNDRLLALKIFIRVAQTGSFSRAGKELGLSQPSASRLVAALEREVGTALLIRNTRAVVLTQAGAEYLARIGPALAILEEAREAARGGGELRGSLRIGLPASIAIREIIPRLAVFMARHPSLRIDLVMEDGRQDLVRDAIDVAIRFGDLQDSTATARRIGVNQRLLVASPDYLARSGKLKAPSDLQSHRVIVGPPGSTNGAWTFTRDGHTVSVTVDGQLAVNVNEAAIAAGAAGLGIVSGGLWGCRAELSNGTLVHVLPNWVMASVDVHAVFAAGGGTKQAARAFVDHIAADLGLTDRLVEPKTTGTFPWRR